MKLKDGKDDKKTRANYMTRGDSKSFLDKYIKLIYYTCISLIYWRKILNRQNIRKLILIISLLLFPITIWYMSPYLIIQGAMEGIVSGSFIVFACMLLGSIFFGRIFCGWLCPMGGMQECLFSVNEKVKF